MKSRLYYVLLGVAIILVPVGAALGWWYYWPTYNRRHLLSEAEMAIEADNLASADEVLQRLLREEPKQLRCQFLHAQVLRRLGRYQEAWEALHRAMLLDLPEPEGLREYALLEAVDNFPFAENALRRVLEEHPDDLEVLQVLAEGYARSHRWLDAERAATRLTDLRPERVDLLLQRGQILMEAGRFDQAAGDFCAILRLSPQHFRARLWLSHCLLSAGKIDEAEPELLICRQQRPARSEPLIGLATCAAERNDLGTALALVKEALSLDSSALLALHLLGEIYLRQQRYDLAIPVFEKILRLNPRDKQGHLHLAQALSVRGEAERAQKHERRFQQLDREEEQLRQLPARPK